MDMMKSEISSIGFESEVDKDDQILSMYKDISSISGFSDVSEYEVGMGTNFSGAEVKALRENLTENVNNLQKEVKLFANINRNEGSTRRDSINTIEILEQINNIKTSVDSMKKKLKDSQELVVQKTQENECLKNQLFELEVKNFTSHGNCVVCKNCNLF